MPHSLKAKASLFAKVSNSRGCFHDQGFASGRIWRGACALSCVGRRAVRHVRAAVDAQVKFYDCGGKLCGKVVNVKDASRAKEVGTVILNGAAKSGDNQWKGSLLDTDNGKTYSGVVTLESPDALNLKGCVAMICQGETWRRVQ